MRRGMVAISTAQLDGSKIGDKLEALFSRLESEGVKIGIRQRVTAGRIAAHIIEQERKLSEGRWAFLLRSRLTPALAKSPADIERVRAAFLEIFPEERKSEN